VASQLRGDILSGRIEPGQFLANERDLAGQLAVSRETLRRALKSLENEGLVKIVPRRGYQVLAGAHDPQKGAPIGYIMTGDETSGAWTPRMDAVLSAMQRVAARKGWPLLVLGAPNAAPDKVGEQLRSTKTCGLVLDTIDPEMLALAARAGLPAVVVNDWSPDLAADSVMQDGQHAGLLAARHLLGRGRREIAWVGPSLATGSHAFDRLSGALAELARSGVELTSMRRLELPVAERDQRLAEMLSDPAGRPDGIISLWTEQAVAVAAVARRLGLELGRDLDLVGWSIDELYAGDYVKAMAGGPVPPAVTWSAAAMAETALARLEERRANPQLPAARIKVPVRLRTDGV